MPFKFEKTPIEGLVIIQPRQFEDDRGYFQETYKKSDFVAHGIHDEFMQDNHSFSSQGTLRGLHFQTGQWSQGKLVRVVKGAVWDVAVDLRPHSPTFKQHYGIELTEQNGTLFYVPPGFAHGFLTLTDNTHFLYKCTAEYHPEADGGVRYNDEELAISWPAIKSKIQLSPKDLQLPYLRDLKPETLW